MHCRSEAQALFVHRVLKQRFEECGLELHPNKTKIVYCKDGRRTGDYIHTSFDFLGYTFRRRGCWVPQYQRMTLGFVPAVSQASLKGMRSRIRKSRLRQRTDLSLPEIAKWLNPIIEGWLNYYGAFYKSAMYGLIRHVNKSLVRWAICKYKSLRRGKRRALALLERVLQQSPRLFVHWRKGMTGAFA